jgi:CHASE3 domain sensor protein
MSTAVSTVQRIKVLFRRGHLRQTGTSCLFCAVVLLLSGMMLLGANVSKLRDSYAWVQRSDTVLLQLAEVESRLVGVEMTVRGYALTDDPAFLGYQKPERERLLIAMDKLAALLGGDASRAALFMQLQDKTEKRLVLYAYLSALGPGHAQDVAAAIRDPAKRNDMNMAHDLIRLLRVKELKLLAARQDATAQQAAHSYNLAFGIVVLAFALSALGFALMLYGRGRAA